LFYLLTGLYLLVFQTQYEETRWISILMRMVGRNLLGCFFLFQSASSDGEGRSRAETLYYFRNT